MEYYFGCFKCCFDHFNHLDYLKRKAVFHCINLSLDQFAFFYQGYLLYFSHQLFIKPLEWHVTKDLTSQAYWETANSVLCWLYRICIGLHVAMISEYSNSLGIHSNVASVNYLILTASYWTVTFTFFVFLLKEQNWYD